MKFLIVMATLLLPFSLYASAPDLDQLLVQIEEDIAAKRLSSPLGNNALARIDEFRAAAPYDYRIVPLTYQWGEAYVELANKAIDGGNLTKAQGYLDRVWYIASLTPGLETAQARIEQAGGNRQIAKPTGPSSAERDRQKQVAAAVAKEKARLAAEQKRLAAEKKRLEQELKQQQAAVRKQQEEQRRQQQIAQAKKQAAKPIANAQPAAKPQPKKNVKPAPTTVSVAASTEQDRGITELWENARERRDSIASFTLAEQMVEERNREIVDNLTDACQSILDNDASVVIHTDSKADYRWLTVRLTLCLRRIDESFRLRHSHQLSDSSEPYLTLHPPRTMALIQQVP